MNGQVVLWDISQHTDRLKQSRSTGKTKDAFGALVRTNIVSIICVLTLVVTET